MSSDNSTKVSLELFNSRKEKELQGILDRTNSRLKEDHHSDYNIDLDILPVLNAWNKILFTYTMNSASGTMKEHGTHECRNGVLGEPHGFIHAYSFQKHPLFEKFRQGLSELSGFDTSLSKPGENEYYFEICTSQDKGLYVHLLRIWAPKKDINKDDSYLITHWKKLELYLNNFMN